MRTSALHQNVKNSTALWAIFAAVAVFFTSFSYSVGAERQAASILRGSAESAREMRLREAAALQRRLQHPNQRVNQRDVRTGAQSLTRGE